MNSKYIVHDHEAILFPTHFDHSETARKLGFNLDDIQGAGFISFGDGGCFDCYGESFSLNIKSRGEEDNRCVKRLFNPDTWWMDEIEEDAS